MRSNALKSCAVGAMLIVGTSASVARAGAILPVDPFTASGSVTSFNSMYQSTSQLFAGGLFDTRSLTAIGYENQNGGWAVSSTASIGGGALSFITTQTNASSNAWNPTGETQAVVSWFNANGSSVNLNGFQGFSFDYSGASGRIEISVLSDSIAFTDEDGISYPKQATAIRNVFATSGQSISILAADFDWGTDGNNQAITPSWNAVTGIVVGFYRNPEFGSVGDSWTMTMSNFVPAPGAAALVGLAGLVGGRRRRA